MEIPTFTLGEELTKEQEAFLDTTINEVGYRLRPNPALPDVLELWRRHDFHLDDQPLHDGNYTLVHDRVMVFVSRPERLSEGLVPASEFEFGKTPIDRVALADVHATVGKFHDDRGNGAGRRAVEVFASTILRIDSQLVTV